MLVGDLDDIVAVGDIFGTFNWSVALLLFLLRDRCEAFYGYVFFPQCSGYLSILRLSETFSELRVSVDLVPEI